MKKSEVPYAASGGATKGENVREIALKRVQGRLSAASPPRNDTMRTPEACATRRDGGPPARQKGILTVFALALIIAAVVIVPQWAHSAPIVDSGREMALNVKIHYSSEPTESATPDEKNSPEATENNGENESEAESSTPAVPTPPTAPDVPKRHGSHSRHSSTIDLDEEIGGSDMVRIFGVGSMESGEKARDVVLIFSEGTIKGEVSNDCVVIGGKLHLKKGARINGDLVLIFSSVSTEGEIPVKGDKVNIGSYQESGLAWVILKVFSGWDLLFALFLILLFPRFVMILTDRFLGNPTSSFFYGFLGFVGFVPLILLLVISVVGILLIPVVPIVYFIAFAAGFAVMANLAGDRLQEMSGAAISQPLKAVLGLVIILGILKLIGFFPLFGGITAELIKMVIRTAGLGLVVVMIWEKAARRKA